MSEKKTVPFVQPVLADRILTAEKALKAKRKQLYAEAEKKADVRPFYNDSKWVKEKKLSKIAWHLDGATVKAIDDAMIYYGFEQSAWNLLYDAKCIPEVYESRFAALRERADRLEALVAKLAIAG